MPEDEKLPPVDLELLQITTETHVRKPGEDCFKCKGMMFKLPGCWKRAADEAKPVDER